MNCWLVGIPTLGAGLQEAMKRFHSKHFVHTTIFEWWIVLNLHRDVFFLSFLSLRGFVTQMDGRLWKHDIYPDPRCKRPGHQDEQTNPVHFPLTEEQAVVVVPFCHGWLWMQANHATDWPSFTLRFLISKQESCRWQSERHFQKSSHPGKPQIIW